MNLLRLKAALEKQGTMPADPMRLLLTDTGYLAQARLNAYDIFGSPTGGQT